MTVSQPNLLIIMSDEHAPHFMGAQGHPIVQTPNLDALASGGVLFDNAYCNTPLCSPSRMSFMTGRYAHQIGAFDNSTSLSLDEPTWAHRLRSVGYEVVLCGKQHFVGPDQLHGFNQQIARDLHAESFHELLLWDDGTPPTPAPWRHIGEAGPGRTTEVDVDDLVEERALEWLSDPARQSGGPWALNIGFIAPHFPFVVPDEFWNLYPVDQIDLPRARPETASQHPVYRRMRQMFGLVDFSDDQVRRARAGYYALITWLDAKVGRILAALEATGQRENTVVIYVSDHGEMAGEHGMWRKSNFREASARVPLIVSWPGHFQAGKRVAGVTSLVDVVATILELGCAPLDDSLAGDSLLPVIRGNAPWKDEAFCEYLAHGVAGPMAMLRRGRFKLNFSLGDPLELFDIASDPDEFRNLADNPDYASVRDTLLADLLGRWDPVDLDKEVRASQRARKLIEETVPPASYIH